MKKTISICLILAAGAGFMGCGEDDSSAGPVAVNYTYSQFVHFDSTEYRLVKRDQPWSAAAIKEPLVNWEQSLGEPFTDQNENGIYDPGIDSFTISPDPDINQDLNRNGEYDSPDDPWTEGIPFDDIDGNGVFRPDPGNHVTGYELGLPYSDYNKNLRHDNDLKASYGISEWKTGVWYGDGITYWLERYDPAVYRFVSDSDLTYDLHLSYNPTMKILIVTDTAISYRIVPFTVTLLRPGPIEAQDSIRIELPQYPEPIVYFRWVTLDQFLNVDNLSFSNLVKVRIGNDDFRYDFYFSRDLGLIAYEFWEDNTEPPENWNNYERLSEYYFVPFEADHPLTFPMTR